MAIAILVIDFLLMRSQQICYNLRSKYDVKKIIFIVKYVAISMNLNNFDDLAIDPYQQILALVS